MTQQSVEVNAGSTGVREYRSRVAQALITLLRKGDAMDGVNWAQLDQMPAWILCSDAELSTLTHQVAITAVASSLARSIDGTLLHRISNLVGAEFLKRALNSHTKQSTRVLNLHFDLDVDVLNAPTEPMLDGLGTSILLSSIECPALAQVVSRRFKADPVKINLELATECIRLTQMNLTAEQSVLEKDVHEPLPKPGRVASALLSSGAGALATNVAVA